MKRPASMRYISLVQNKHGDYYMVRFAIGCKNKTVTAHKCFAVKKHGGKQKALKLAKEYRDKMAAEYGKSLNGSALRARYRRKTHANRSGLVGIHYVPAYNGRRPRVVVSWTETGPEGKRVERNTSRAFSDESERRKALKWAIATRKEKEALHYIGSQ